MDFPQTVSFTVTNRCNLACRMCGQWSEEGYMHGRRQCLQEEMALADWKRLADELAEHEAGSVILRGGEPFLLPGIMELLRHISSKGMFISIDTNGTMLGEYAEEIVRIPKLHLTVSVDGPEEVHDSVRGVPGCFARIRENLAKLAKAEERSGNSVSRGICFTISRYSVGGLGAMPDVARSLGLGTVTIVPYYWVPARLGEAYERELRDEFQCGAFSWRGFHHETSGVDVGEFMEQYRRYRENLGDVYSYPYLALTDEEYATWFSDPEAPVRSPRCMNVERLIDIQPGGDANFCVDFPDYSIGNVKDSTIEELWNSERTERFRRLRRERPLAVCHRCGAKYMSELPE
jgi:MoaA/NifB/PqqE/SkfB family radical SAM enzyme